LHSVDRYFKADTVLEKNIRPFFEEFIRSGTINQNKFIDNIPWNTREFGFFALNKNAIFMVEGINRFINDKKQNVNIFPLTPRIKWGDILLYFLWIFCNRKG